MAELGFALSVLDDVPAGDAWLGPRERTALRRLAVPARRAQWRLGRWAARQALATIAGVDAANVEIVAASDGAPEAWDAGGRLPVSVSISHRGPLAVAVAAPGEVNVGCDVELVEKRPSTFGDDWFTRRERDAVERVAAGERDAVVTLIWSAKETALKALRQGLRLDTREVEVSLEDRTYEAKVRDTVISGWWRRDGPYVITAGAQETKR
jgi:4'-phosphopantetheinyl transferase